MLALLILFANAHTEYDQCQTGLERVLSVGFAQIQPTNVWGKMYSYSGLRLNDLGDMEACNNLSDASYAIYQRGSQAVIGICVPSVCTREALQEILANIMSGNILEYKQNYPGTARFFQGVAKQTELGNFKDNFQLMKKYGYSQNLQADGNQKLSDPILFPAEYIEDNFRTFEWGPILMTIVLSFLVTLGILGTTLDLYFQFKDYIVQSIKPKMKQTISKELQQFDNKEPLIETQQQHQKAQDHNTLIKVILCFSVYSNLIKLSTSRSAERVGERNTLDIFNGIRTMSICWVVVGHVVLIQVQYLPVYNFYEIPELFKKKKLAMIYGAEYAVDVFFWMSGFLMTYLLIGQLIRSKGLTPFGWFYIYFHRFYRILPVYMFVLFAMWAYTKYFGFGPVWIYVEQAAVYPQCKDYWWTNMLFINNFVPNWEGNQCFGWAWYLANDMQFFILSVPIVYLYFRYSRVIGWLVITGLIYMSMLANFFISRHYNFFVNGSTPGADAQSALYVKPYARCGPYLIGLLCGMILYSKHHFEKTGKVYDRLAFWFSRLTNIFYIRWIGYSIGAVLINVYIFSEYSAFDQSIKYGHDTWTHEAHWFWYALSRPIWTLGFSFIMMPLLLGHGPFVRRILSADFWTPFARLAFTVYLIHFPILSILASSKQRGFYLDDLNLFMMAIVIVFSSFVAALPVSLLIESPLLSLEKIIFRRQ